MTTFETRVSWLCEFASKDQTRYHLNSIHRHERHGFVSTDGHRLLCVEEGAVFAPHEMAIGYTCETDAFKIGAFKSINCSYPNINQIIPDHTTYPHEFKITLPKWIKNLKGARINAPMGFGANGRMTTIDPLVTVNLQLIALLAEQDCTLYIKDSTCPVVFKGDKWRAVVMPLRA